MDKKIGLEHTIRNIMNAPVEGEKKTGLEHTIRNIVSESIGSGISTDKFKKTPNSFFKPVHIEPKKGDEHVNGYSSVRASRNVQKERNSETMKEEDQLDELVAPAVKGATEIGKFILKRYKTSPKKVPEKNLAPPIEAPTKPKAPTVEPSKPTIEPEVPAPAPAPVPKTPTPKKPDVSPETPGGLPFPILPVPVPVPGTTPTPGTDKLTKPKTGETPSPTPGVGTGPTPTPGPKGRGKDKSETKKRSPFLLPGLTPGQTTGVFQNSVVPVNIYKHMPAEYMYHEETDFTKDAVEIKRKTRKAQIIKKIIDEAKTKKTKNTETVNLHPKLKNLEPDEIQ
jgi:hypothetical protein